MGTAYWYGYEDGYADAGREAVVVPDEVGPYRHGYLDGVEAWGAANRRGCDPIGDRAASGASATRGE